jgi:hypothetical protein
MTEELICNRVAILQQSPLTPTPTQEYFPSRPVPRGAVARRHERGTGCGGRGSVGAKRQSQGGLRLVSGLAGARTNGARRVRRSRVVLASVADVKPAEAESARPGLAKP